MYGGSDSEKYKRAAHRIEHSNRITSMAFSLIAFGLIMIMFISSFINKELSRVRYIYILGLLFSPVLFGMGLLAKNRPRLTYACMYTAGSGFSLYGIAVGTIDRPEMQTVTFMVMLIMFPLIFIDKPYRVFVFLAAYIVLFIIAALNTKTGTVLFTDVIDAVIFGILSMAGGVVSISAKVKGFVLEDELKTLSETDTLTGLNNRNSYEWRLSGYPDKCVSSLACVYIDVNGLHNLNYKSGHKAGDVMLQCVAAELKSIFGSNDTYRTGGDEYVAFVADTDEKAVAEQINALRANVEKQGYHIATGCSFSTKRSLDMNVLIMDAEKKMYEDKEEYYKMTNMPRRI